MPPTIESYYRWAIKEIEQEVEATADANAASLIDKYGMVPIKIDTSREVQMVKVEREHVSRGYNIYTNQMPGSVVKTTDVRLEVPVVRSDTLEAIVTQKLAPMPYSLGVECPPFKYDNERSVVSIVARATEEEIKHARETIQTNIDRYNGNITEQNKQFPAEVERIITANQERLSTKNKNLDELSVKLGIPLVKKADS